MICQFINQNHATETFLMRVKTKFVILELLRVCLKASQIRWQIRCFWTNSISECIEEFSIWKWEQKIWREKDFSSFELNAARRKAKWYSEKESSTLLISNEILQIEGVSRGDNWLMEAFISFQQCQDEL